MDAMVGARHNKKIFRSTTSRRSLKIMLKLSLKIILFHMNNNLVVNKKD